MRAHRGPPYPLGATRDGQGIHVAVFSEVAETTPPAVSGTGTSPTRARGSSTGPVKVLVDPYAEAVGRDEAVPDTTAQHRPGERVKDSYSMTSRSAAVLPVTRPVA